MSIKQIIGLIMLALPFVALFAILASIESVLVALGIFSAAAAIILVVLVGVGLLVGEL